MPIVKLSAMIRPTNITIYEEVYIPEERWQQAVDDDEIEELIGEITEEWLVETVETDYVLLEEGEEE